MYGDSEKDKGYIVRRFVPVGTPVTMKRSISHYGLMVLEAGERVTIRGFTNMGFGGIDATVEDEVGLVHHHIPAGALAAPGKFFPNGTC